MQGWRLSLAVVFLVAACGGGGGPLGTSVQGLASGDVPGGFTHCPQSGDAAKITDKDTAGEWQYAQKQGATSGDIEVYADSAGNCKGMPDIRPGGGKIVASAVLHYKDAAAATAASNGMFGASPGNIPGAIKGSASGFGDKSAYVFSGTTGLVLWQPDSTTLAAVVSDGLAEADFKKAAQDVKGRVS